jgi:hypothetical protein
VLFAAAPDDEERVRGLIDGALAQGEGEDPHGSRTHWRVIRTGRSPVRPEEGDHARRLVRS